MRIVNSLVDLLFPPRCANCRRTGAWLCSECRAEIVRLAPPWCAKCGQLLEPQVSIPSRFATGTGAATCADCRAQPLQIDGLRAAAHFQGPLREAIHRLKYNHCTALAPTLAGLLVDFLRAYPIPADVIVPVPLHPKRERSRGYNQAVLLAQELAVSQKLPMWYNVVERVRATTPQVKLDAAARRQNMRDAFTATTQVAGVRVLLIDDVCTTGATMEACSIALMRRGAKSVWGLALARGR